MPFVSVVIPTFNRRDYILIAIESVLSQTYVDYEIIVVDDGSTDDTAHAISTQFGKHVVYIYQQNQGESVARNRGIAQAQGDYIAFLDSDDYWHPSKLEKQIEFLTCNPGVVLLGSASWIVDDKGAKLLQMPMGRIGDANLLSYSALRLHCHFYGPSTAVMPRQILQDVGLFDPLIRYGEDWDLWLRLSALGRIAVLPEPLAYIRRHSGTQTLQLNPEVIDRRLEDHVRILSKNPIRECDPMHETGDPAMAKCYLRAGLDDIAIGRLDLAEERLRQSVAWDQGMMVRQDGIGIGIERAIALSAPQYEPLPIVRSYFQTALMYMIRCVGTELSTTLAWERLYLGLASMARSTKNWPAVRRNLWQALLNNPQTLRTPVFLGGMLESCVGSRVFSFLHSIYARFHPESD